jgi:O-antigen/teichoic acid export membrane protein
LSLLFGMNIVFDNIIYSIRNINIAESTQKRNFVIFIIEAIIKFLVACVLFVYPFSVTTLAVVLIVIRLGTLGLFLRIGTSGDLNLTHFWRSKVNFAQIRELVVSNWSFIVIGSVAIIYWRIAHIIISKVLTLKDVAHYEISFKLFSLAQLIPLVVSTTVFPSLIKLYNAGERAEFGSLYKKVFKLYMLFGLFSFSFIYAFADVLIPLAFGDAYADTAFYTKQMFLTILVFPTAYLQANLLVAMRLERFDMWFNILSLAANLLLIFVGLYFVRSLLVINYSIFLSFFAFHVAQDILLVRKNIATPRETLLFYAGSIAVTVGFIYLSSVVSPYLVFAGAWLVFLVFVLPNTTAFKEYMLSLKNPSNH